jgi:hypothetical protein
MKFPAAAPAVAVARAYATSSHTIIAWPRRRSEAMADIFLSSGNDRSWAFDDNFLRANAFQNPECVLYLFLLA